MKGFGPNQYFPYNPDVKHKETTIGRRGFLKTGLAAGALGTIGAVGRQLPIEAYSADKSNNVSEQHEVSVQVDTPLHLRNALEIAADTYPANRVKDQLSFTNKTGYRMTVSPNGYPVAICMSPDLTFGMLGSRFIQNRSYLDTFLGHLNFLPRNMRRNGKFFINEDLMAGADRVLSQVVYMIWIWELYLATGDRSILEFHRNPLKRCLSYIESRTNSDGIVTQVDPDDWQYSEGADWVDWCPERMEGSTCVYHTWYAYALNGCRNIFDILEDEPSKIMCGERLQRQNSALNRFFWNGEAYWDNLNFQGEKVGHFWCDSQIWPIAFGFSSEEQAGKIFRRIDAEPKVFEGVPMRWCAPAKPEDEDPRYLPGGKYGDTRRPELHEYTWFGRLGSGDILARYQMGQNSHAFNLINRYAEVVSELGTITECLDMDGKIQRGTNGQGNYLEHAGGFLWCTGKGLFGIDDTSDGIITWNLRMPGFINKASMPYWHMGNCWKFGCDEKNYWINPGTANEKIRLIRNGETKELHLDGKLIQFQR